MHDRFIGASFDEDLPSAPKRYSEANASYEASVSTSKLLNQARGGLDALRRQASVAGREAARVGAHGMAVECFRTALAFVEPCEVEERIELLEAYACESCCMKPGDDAFEAQRTAVALHRASGDHSRESAGLQILSILSGITGNRRAALAYAEHAVDLLEHAGGGALQLEQARARLSVRATKPPFGCGVLSLAELSPGPPAYADALSTLAIANVWTAPDRSRHQILQSIKTAARHNLSGSTARGMFARALLEYALMSYRRAERLAEASRKRFVSTKEESAASLARALIDLIKMQTGRWVEVYAAADELIRNMPPGPQRVQLLIILYRIKALTEDCDNCPWGKELAARFEKGRGAGFAEYSGLICELAWIGKRSMREALLASEVVRLGRPKMMEDVWYWRWKLFPGIEMPDAGHFSEPYRLLFRGNWKAAAVNWSRVGGSYQQALALLEGGAEANRQAICIFDRLGATVVSRHVRRLMQRRDYALAAQSSLGAACPSTRLTKRQMDVLLLLDQGQSNNEIAHRLFISPKTVDHHVSAILGELAARTRHEAAAIARRVGLI